MPVPKEKVDLIALRTPLVELSEVLERDALAAAPGEHEAGHVGRGGGGGGPLPAGTTHFVG